MANNIQLQQLKGFIAVARCKSFSLAAKKTFRSQPAISLQIKSLAKELGIEKLFNRIGNRKIVLTEEGDLLFNIVSPLIDDIDRLPTRIKELKGRPKKGSITIATHTSVIVHLLPETLTEFTKKFPECELSIVNRDRKGILSMLNEGEADIGITSLSDVPTNVDYKVFTRFERMLIAPKGHPLSKKAAIIPEELIPYPLLLPPKGSNSRSVIDDVFKKRKLAYRLAMEITGKAAIETYVRMGLGIAIINGFYVSKDDKAHLFCKPMGKFFGEAERGIITKKNRYLSFHVKEFISILRKQYKT